MLGSMLRNSLGKNVLLSKSTSDCSIERFADHQQLGRKDNWQECCTPISKENNVNSHQMMLHRLFGAGGYSSIW